MRNKLPLLMLLVLLASSALQKLQAKIWRINNNGYGADYVQINAANNDPNVIAGDTLHLEGSNTDYSGASITKKLTIIGPGYFLNENPKTTTTGLSATMPYIRFDVGSNGSQIMGVVFDRSSSGIGVYASNILIKRCRINYGGIYLNYGISNISILQNFFLQGTSTSTGTIINTTSSGFPSGVYFNNNIVQFPLVLSYPTASYTLTECRNNVFDVPAITGGPSLDFYAAVFQNNIITNPTATVRINGITNFTTNPTPAVAYNVSASAAVQFGTANNNIVVTSQTASLFVPSTTSNSTDGKYQLQSGSAASGNGSDGTDRGAFGGAGVQNRYTLSGLAPVPVVYEINTTGYSSPSTGLPVTVKSRIIQ